MACNCGECGCRVIAGTGAVVTGTGTQSDPFVISANSGSFEVENTDCILMELEGTGTAGDPYVISAEPNIHQSPDNLLVCEGAGLLVDCDAVVDCVGNRLGCGLEFNNGLICVMISEDDGNQIECRADGLYASFDCDALGCGLTLDGGGAIAVNTGTAGTTKAGLICDEDTGVLGVDPGCGIEIDVPGRVGVTHPHVTDQSVVGNRDLNVPVPATVQPGQNDIPGRGVNTEQMDVTQQPILFLDNTENCYPVRGYTSMIAQAVVEQFPDTDLTVTLEISNNAGPFEVVDIWRRHIPAGANNGQPTIETINLTRVDVTNVNAGANRTVEYRLSFHRTPQASVGNDRSGPGFQANVLAFTYTVQYDGTYNR